MVAKDPTVTQQSVSFAQQANASERVELLKEILKTFDDGTQLSTADEANLQKWAEIAYVASRRLGPFALREAEARRTAASLVRMMHQVDAQNAEEYGGRYIPEDHFEAGLRAYFAVLQGVFVQEREEPAGLKASVLSPDNILIAEYLYCPECAPEQRRTEATLRNAVPAAHMDACETRQRDGSIVRLANLSWDADELRCCRCQIDEEEPF